MEMIPILETKSYILRGMNIDDSRKLFTFMGDRETMKYLTPHPVETEKEMKDYIIASLEKLSQQKELPWVVINKETEELIGMFRLHKLNMWHKKAEMGVVIRKEFQERGVMTEILRMMIPYCFQVLDLNRLVGDIFSKNEGSKKLLMKFGFHMDGILRETDYDGKEFHDTIVFSMLKDEFNSKLKQGLFE